MLNTKPQTVVEVCAGTVGRDGMRKVFISVCREGCAAESSAVKVRSGDFEQYGSYSVLKSVLDYVSRQVAYTERVKIPVDQEQTCAIQLRHHQRSGGGCMLTIPR
jgi:hypothetical protein